MSPKPVFISYLRSSDRDRAIALEAQLGVDACYRDERSLIVGEPYPSQLLDALLDAQVVVCFVSDAYLESPFCRGELQLASAGAPEGDCWGGLIIAAPRGSGDSVFQRLSVGIARMHWPMSDSISELADLVGIRLRQRGGTSLRMEMGAELAAQIRLEVESAVEIPSEARFDRSQICANLPANFGDGFYGRAYALRAIDDLFGREARSVAIVGPPGMGKTRLAVEYGRRYGPRRFELGVVWLSASQRVQRDQALHEVLRRLDGQAPTLEVCVQESRGILGRIGDLLDARADGRLLWIVDDLLPGRDPAELLQEWAPLACTAIRILVTSRERVPRSRNIELDPLDRRAAGLVVGHSLPRDLLRPEEIAEIVDAVGCWPIALEILNAGFRSQARRPRETIESLRAGPSSTLDSTAKLVAYDLPERARTGFSGLLVTSYERLSEPARLVWKALSYFAASVPIPETLLASVAEPILQPVRRDLANCGVLRDHSGASIGSIHVLLADFGRSRDADRSGLQAALALVTNWRNRVDQDDPQCWPELGESLSHLSSVAEAVGVGNSQGLEGRDWICRFLLVSGQYRAAEVEIARLCDDIEQREPASAAMLVATSRRATLLERQGRGLEAAQLWSQLGGVWDSIIRRNPQISTAALEEAIRSHGNAATLFRMVDQESDAVDEDRRAKLLESRTELGEGTIINRRNRAMGLIATDASRATVELRQCLQQLTSLLGKRHVHTLRTQSLLAVAMFRSGETEDGERLLRDALDAAIENLGNQHPDTLESQHQLAALEASSGRLEAALERANAVLRGRSELLGSEHPDVVKTGRLVEAIENRIETFVHDTDD